MAQRSNIVSTSNRSNDQRYNNIGRSFNNVLYTVIITKWRLSNHNLKIEKGRNSIRITPREERLCIVCNTLEDEQHALFFCKIHATVQIKFKSLLDRYTSVNEILNPKSVKDAYEIANYLIT